MKLLIFLFAMFSLFGCEDKFDNRVTEDLRWLLNADPEDDFKKSIAAGDLRFIGVIGMSFTVPYFDEKCVTEDKVRFIQVSDMVNSYEQEKLQAIAPIYAENFNLYMLKHWNSQGLKRCDS